MPIWTASAKPTVLAPGQILTVLNAENLAAGSSTEAFTFTPGNGGPITLTLFCRNLGGGSASLYISALNIDGDYVAAINSFGVGVSVTGNASLIAIQLSSSFFYRLEAANAIAGGSIWVGR